MFVNKCNDECPCNVEGINAQYGYNAININDDDDYISCEDKMAIGRRMLNEIRCLMFAITDLAQYLNTHPRDEKALCLHQEYCRQLKDLKDKYQRVYGPLSIYCPCNKWRWLEEPWPWEGSEI